MAQAHIDRLTRAHASCPAYEHSPQQSTSVYSRIATGSIVDIPPAPNYVDNNVLHRELSLHRASQGLKDSSGLGHAAIGQDIADTGRNCAEPMAVLALKQELQQLPLVGPMPEDLMLLATLRSRQMSIAKAKQVLMEQDDKRRGEHSIYLAYDSCTRPAPVMPATLRNGFEQIEDLNTDGSVTTTEITRASNFARQRLYYSQRTEEWRDLAASRHIIDTPQLQAYREKERNNGHIHPSQYGREALFIEKYGKRPTTATLGGLDRPQRSPFYSTSMNYT